MHLKCSLCRLMCLSVCSFLNRTCYLMVSLGEREEKKVSEEEKDGRDIGEKYNENKGCLMEKTEGK